MHENNPQLSPLFTTDARESTEISAGSTTNMGFVCRRPVSHTRYIKRPISILATAEMTEEHLEEFVGALFPTSTWVTSTPSGWPASWLFTSSQPYVDPSRLVCATTSSELRKANKFVVANLFDCIPRFDTR